MNERMKIMIASDGSECADAAIDNLRRGGLPSEADALVVSVAEVWFPPPPAKGAVLNDAFPLQIPVGVKWVRLIAPEFKVAPRRSVFLNTGLSVARYFRVVLARERKLLDR